jgi:hypothetical protein
MNHKWKDINETEFGTKPKQCIHCGVTKYWHGGNYQCWQYKWAEKFETQAGHINSRLCISFHRPDCKKPTEAKPTVINLSSMLKPDYSKSFRAAK